MKKQQYALIGALILTTQAYAHPRCTGPDCTNIPAPEMTSYFAHAGKLQLTKPKGFYINGKALVGNGTMKDITRADFMGPNPDVPEKLNHNTYGGGASLGFAFQNRSNFFPNRFEAAYAYRLTPYKTDQFLENTFPQKVENDVNSQTIMVNIFNDIIIGDNSLIVPYIGAGVGASINKLRLTVTPATKVDSDRRSNFAYSLMAGVRVQINHEVFVDVGYEYVDLGKIPTWTLPTATGVTTISVDRVENESLMIGLTWQIGDIEDFE